MFNYFTKFLVSFFLLIGGFSSTLLADFYVIPVVKKVPNVVHVAQSGGDFNSPVDAMNSITDASAENPYLIKLEAGTYELSSTQLVIKPYVWVVGAGPDVTTIRGATGSVSDHSYSSSSLVIAGNNTTISSLKIQSYSSQSYSSNLYCVDANVTLENLKITKSGISNGSKALVIKNSYVNAKNIEIDTSEAQIRSYAVYMDASTLNINNLSVTDTSITTASSSGVYLNNNAYLDIKDSLLNISGSGEANQGIMVATSSKITVVDTEINISNGQTSNYGIYTIVDSSAMLNNVAITANGADSIAVFRAVDSRISVMNSTLEGDSRFARTDSNIPLTISHSQLIGLKYSGVVCVACINGDSEALSDTCVGP